MDAEMREHLMKASPAMMNTACNALKHTVDDFFTNLESWDDVYDVLQESIGIMGRAVTSEGVQERRDSDSMLRLTIGSLFVKGYASFRQSQPTMTDFGLAKDLILHHIHRGVDEAHGGYFKMRKEAGIER